jgi:Rrf2 family protein
MLSGTAQYALRAVLHLAAHRDDAPIPAANIAAALDIPDNYLGKILYQLGRQGILHSLRGKKGGFSLAVPPEQLSLLKVVEPFDRIGEHRSCLLGRPECSDGEPCAAHHRWKEVARQVEAFFRDTTAADLLKTQD